MQNRVNQHCSQISKVALARTPSMGEDSEDRLPKQIFFGTVQALLKANLAGPLKHSQIM